MPSEQCQNFFNITNIYCDESCHLQHDEYPNMVLGALSCPKVKVREISDKIKELKEKTGNDKEVQDYVMSFEQTQNFFTKLTDMMTYMVPLYSEEGKTNLTIAIGCTGGKHRSVTIANKLGEDMQGKGYDVNMIYRDISR